VVPISLASIAEALVRRAIGNSRKLKLKNKNFISTVTSLKDHLYNKTTSKILRLHSV